MRAALILAAIVVVVGITVLAIRRPGRRGGPGRSLRYVTVASAFVIGLIALPLLIDDRGGVLSIALTTAPPLVITTLAAVAPRFGRAGTVVVWLSVLLMLAYLVLFGLGLGLLYVPTLLLLVATAVTISSRSRADEATAQVGSR
jgi:hypothetical protein